MSVLRAHRVVAPTQLPSRRRVHVWWGLGIAVSLLLHGAAAAAFFLPWGSGPRLDAGGTVVVDVVTFSGPGVLPAGPPGVRTRTGSEILATGNEPGATAAPSRHENDDLAAEDTLRTAKRAPTRGLPPDNVTASTSRPDLKGVAPVSEAAFERENLQAAAVAPPTPSRKPGHLDQKDRNDRVAEAVTPVPTAKPAPDPTVHSSEIAETGTGGRSRPRENQTVSLSQARGRPGQARQAGGSGGGGDLGAAPVAGNPQPQYPYRARQRGWEGRVVLSISVDPTGIPTGVAVSQSSGYNLLDRAAMEAVRTWKFEPARREGRPVASELTLPVRFALKD